MRELARRASLERSRSEERSPDSDAFKADQLIVELELDPILRSSGVSDCSAAERAWKGLVGEISSHMARSTSVVVRGGNPSLSTNFSKASMELQFGSLGQSCEWVDGVLFAIKREAVNDIPFHRTTTLKDFVDCVEDTTTCGNFLDSKDLNPSVPMWMTPLLDSTVAWNQTMHLKFTQKAKKNKKSSPSVVIEPGGPSVIRSPTWTSQGWRLVTHPGFVTFPHHDCCGMCTYVIGTSGAKIWGVIRPKRDSCPKDVEGLSDAFHAATDLRPQGTFSGADVATVCLEKGDIMWVQLFLLPGC